MDRSEKERAKRWQESLLKYTVDNPDDWVECQICGMRSSSLTGLHLPRTHGISLTEYKERFPDAETISKTQLKKMSERMKGENNISAGHGGKNSPFSEKFIGYDGLTDEEKKDKIAALYDTAVTNKDANDNNPKKISYYIKRGMSEDEAKEALSDNQRTFTLEKCVKEHGREEGYKIWQARQDKWMATLNAKTDEEKMEINRKKVDNSSNAVSKNEMEIYEYLKTYIPELQKQVTVMRNSSGIGCFVYDFGVGKKLIEYNGDFWHANPSIYDEAFVNNRNNKTAQQIWDKDEEKYRVAREAGYEVMVLWEWDYRHNKTDSLEKCIQYLTS
jgi:hypothetical protein